MDAQNLMSLKGLPVGKSEFNKTVENEFYYVDKTSYIKTVINDDTWEVQRGHAQGNAKWLKAN